MGSGSTQPEPPDRSNISDPIHDPIMQRDPIRHALITGGAGAIGSRLVRRVLADDASSVTVVDDLSSGYAWLLPDDSRVTLIRGDVCDLARLVPTAERDTVVFHLAAFFANQNSVDHPTDDLHTNGLGTLATLMWAAEHKLRRVVYASAGCSIAGHNVDAPIREDMPVSLFLDTPYQITKALGEFYCNYFQSRLSTVRCRFFNSYGPGEVPGEYRNVIPNWIWKAMHGEPLTITGTGDETRDFIFVDDLVDGLVRCGTVPAATGEAFNLGTGVQTRVRDLAAAILAATESSSEVHFAPRRAWDHSLRRQADIGKAQQILGLAPSVRLEQGIEETVGWFREERSRIEETIGAIA
jgi:nucleoside-diphosphate-sugar epimerase